MTLFMQPSISELSEERINQLSGGVQTYTYIQNNSANIKYLQVSIRAWTQITITI